LKTTPDNTIELGRELLNITPKSIKKLDLENYLPITPPHFERTTLQSPAKSDHKEVKVTVDVEIRSPTQDVAHETVELQAKIEISPEQKKPPVKGVMKHTPVKTAKQSIVYEDIGKEDYLPKLKRSGYYTIPPMEDLAKLSPKELENVKDFTVGLLNVGSVKFFGETNITGLDLDAIIQFEDRAVSFLSLISTILTLLPVLTLIFS